MPCPACKVIIDSGFALRQSIGCMSTSILLAADNPERHPTLEMEQEFKDAAEAVARVAAKIEKYVSRK